MLRKALRRIVQETRTQRRTLLEYEVDLIIREYKEEIQDALMENIHDFYVDISEASEERIQQQQVSYKTRQAIHEQLIIKDPANKDFQFNKIPEYLKRKKRNIQSSVQSNLNRWLTNPRQQITRLIRGEEQLFEYEVNHAVIDYMTENTFQASESIMQRVTSQVYDIIREGIGEEGQGIDQVAQRIQEESVDIANHEAVRIARTETLKAKGEANFQRLMANETVEYKTWMATHDDHTRESHAQLDGQITYKTDPFENGLMYEGDTNGEIEEWINCRCEVVAYYPEVEYVPPPGEPWWYEDDWQINPNFNDVLPPEFDYEITVTY